VNEQALKVEDLERTSVLWLKAVVDSITLTFTFSFTYSNILSNMQGYLLSDWSLGLEGALTWATIYFIVAHVCAPSIGVSG